MFLPGKPVLPARPIIKAQIIVVGSRRKTAILTFRAFRPVREAASRRRARCYASRFGRTRRPRSSVLLVPNTQGTEYPTAAIRSV